MRQARAEGQRIVLVGGPVIVHTGGTESLARLIHGGWVQALLAGNALGVHDIEASLLGTSLGVRQSDGRLEMESRDVPQSVVRLEDLPEYATSDSPWH